MSTFRANLALSQYKKTLDYCKKCISAITNNRSGSSLTKRLNGFAYLYKGKAHMGLSCFKEALEDYEKALSLAHDQDDKKLECLVCCAMCTLYLQVRDYEKVSSCLA